MSGSSGNPAESSVQIYFLLISCLLLHSSDIISALTWHIHVFNTSQFDSAFVGIHFWRCFLSSQLMTIFHHGCHLFHI